MPPPRNPFDVESFRGESRRLAVSRQLDRATLVLGSTQPTDLVAGWALRERGVELARRRGGGGAVYLRPGDHLWIDAWIPRDDPLWDHDVSRAAAWVGAWWTAALGRLGAGGFEVHTGRSVPGELGELVCFAGRGPGEVLRGGRKIVGLSQWRSRDGALFSSCAYRRWDPAPLMELLDIADEERMRLAPGLEGAALGLGELQPAIDDLEELGEALLASFDGWPAGGSPGEL